MKEKNKSKGLFCGLAGLDIVYNMQKLAEENKKESCFKYSFSFAGPALKAAKTFVELGGGETTLISYIGNSSLGKLIKKDCEENKITVIDLADDNELPSISAVAVVKENSSRTIWSGQRKAKKNNFFETFKSKEFSFCLYDCNLPNITKELVKALEKGKTPLVLDCGAWKENIEFALRYAHSVISSSNFKSKEGEDVFNLFLKYNYEYAAKTNNENPIEFLTRGKRGEIEVERVLYANTLGAGDVYHGAFCFYFYQEKKEFEEALTLAARHTREYIENN